MAIVFLTLNGVGIGHLSRAYVFCEAFRKQLQAPVVFSQGIYPTYFHRRFPGKKIKSLGRATSTEQSQIIREIASYAGISEPSIVVEDTHPAWAAFADFINRILIVRPTTFAYMRAVRKVFGASFKRFLICDHPDSPTWPFGREETAEISSWQAWNFVGPVFRSLSERNLVDVRSRYLLNSDTRLYVFTMGGGGTPGSDDPDVPNFISQGAAIGESLRIVDPRCRLVFVRGPLFPPDVALPEIFESVAEEACMPELIALANGAIIRPGFNTVWECLRANVPFVPIPGTTYMEPVEDRLAKLDRLGLTGRESIRFWGDKTWRSDFIARGNAITSRWTGQPEPGAISGILEAATNKSTSRFFVGGDRNLSLDKRDERVLAAAREGLTQIQTNKCLVLRIDALVELTPGVLWLFEECRKRKLSVSLEVVPYLTTLSEADLDRVDPVGLFEVSQHGYANLITLDNDGRRGEFWSHSQSELLVAKQQIEDGFGKLCAAFPHRFRKGFSPPYDGLPDWLDSTWRDAGGKYVSVISANPGDYCLPTISCGTSLRSSMPPYRRPISDIMSELVSSIRERGFAGLVLHRQFLPDPLERLTFARIIDALTDGGVTTQALSTLALG